MHRKFKILMIGLLLLALSLACNFASGGSTTSNPNPANEATVPGGNTGGNGSTTSDIVTDVILAKNTEGDEKNPVDPTTVFGPNDVIHAVVVVEDAPANTTFKSEWYVTDVGDVAPAGSLITEYEISTDGSRNIDFTLSPDTSWPAGTYHVKILVNGEEVSEVSYSVEE